MQEQILHVLIVDDTEEDRYAFRRYLQRDPTATYTIHEASSGSKGLEACALSPPDCLLLDYHLPDMDGTRFLRELNTLKALPVIPVIMVTGTGNEEIVVQAMKLGVLDYLVKGETTPERLRHTIHNALEKAHILKQLDDHRTALEKQNLMLEYLVEENRLRYVHEQEIRTELETAFAAVPDGVIVFDQQGTIVRTNAATRAFFPSDAAVFFDKKDNYAKHQHDDDDNMRIIESGLVARLLKGEVLPSSEAMELVVKAPDKSEHVLMVSGAPLKRLDGSISGAICILHDMTEKYQLQYRVQSAEANERVLREAKRQQDTFLTMVSHELKTPLTSMQLLITFLRRELTDVKYDKAITTLENQLQRITRLVSDLLDMARIKTGQMSFSFVLCDVVQIAHEAVNRIQMSIDTHKIVLTCDMTAWVQADPDRLEQIIVNLVTNAIKYSPEADRVDIRIFSRKRNVVFAIQDYGIGISRQAQVHVFEQYYRSSEAAQRKYPGLGIGLYITSEIVKHHHGQIWVESEESKGSTFSFSLPMKKAGKGCKT